MCFVCINLQCRSSLIKAIEKIRWLKASDMHSLSVYTLDTHQANGGTPMTTTHKKKLSFRFDQTQNNNQNTTVRLSKR